MQISKLLPLLLIGGSFLTSTALAQEIVLITNAPLTKLEAFEARSGTVLVKASAPAGTLHVRPATVLVKYRETTDVSAGRKEHGLTITLQRSEREQDTTVIDYDELESFLSGLAYISKAHYSVTTLPNFEVAIRTRSLFRAFIYTSNNRPGTLQFALHDGQPDKRWVLLSPSQFSEFRTLVEQAKAKLDLLRGNP